MREKVGRDDTKRRVCGGNSTKKRLTDITIHVTCPLTHSLTFTHYYYYCYYNYYYFFCYYWYYYCHSPGTCSQH